MLGCSFRRICSINLKCEMLTESRLGVMSYLLVIPGELLSANSKAFFSSSTGSLWRDSRPEAPCFRANCGEKVSYQDIETCSLPQTTEG